MYWILSIPIILLLSIAYYPPRRLFHYFNSKFPYVVWHNPHIAKTGKKLIALTIDDSPTLYTKQIQEILDQYQAKATWFVIGNYVKNSTHCEVLKDLIAKGHELGNHTMTNKASWQIPIPELKKQLQQTELILTQFTSNNNNNPIKWFRPGSGWFNRSMVEMAHSLNYRVVLGTVYPHDPFIIWPWLNARYILNRVESGDIIIIHDRSWTIKMLHILLPELKRRGFEVVTLSKLFSERQ